MLSLSVRAPPLSRRYSIDPSPEKFRILNYIYYFMLRIFIILLLLTAACPLSADIELVSTCDGTGDRELKGGILDRTCPLGGKTCKAVVSRIVSNATVTPCNDGGWLVKGQIESVKWMANGILSDGLLRDLTKFAKGEYALRLSNISAYPELEGVQVDMASAVMTDNGQFSIYIPKLSR
jgi:hypothetical protein